jgi:hypothetical protein
LAAFATHGELDDPKEQWMPTFRNEVSGTDHAIIGVADEGIGTHGTSKGSSSIKWLV